MDADGTARVEEDLFDPLVGHTVSERFRVLGRLATGGMGAVYRAEQVGLGRPVALKVLRRELSTDRESVARFHREAKAMSLLVHPNTVRVFDFGEDREGHLYLAMELLEGELLSEALGRDGPPPVAEAVEIIEQVLRSLAEAHEKGLIHRDLKPDNIFLARVEGQTRPVVKVLDFGIAKAFREEKKIDSLETQAGTVFGTPRYMSPEQAQGRDLDHRSDLYAVGVLLYELLAGRAPFLDGDAVVVMAKHIQDRPPPLRRVAAQRGIPKALAQVVHAALAKDPARRQADAEAFLAQLAGVRDQSGRIAMSLPPPPPRRLGLGAAVVVLAVGSAIAAGVLAWSQRPEPAPVASTAPAEVAENPPPEAPAPRLVRVAATPEGAEVLRGENVLGTAPLEVAVEPGEVVALTVRAEGHGDAELALTDESEPEVAVALEPIEVAEPDRAPTKVRRRPSGTRAEAAEETEAGEATNDAERDPYIRFD